MSKCYPEIGCSGNFCTRELVLECFIERTLLENITHFALPMLLLLLMDEVLASFS